MYAGEYHFLVQPNFTLHNVNYERKNYESTCNTALYSIVIHTQCIAIRLNSSSISVSVNEAHKRSSRSRISANGSKLNAHPM
jgi:hypothetical protein